MIYILGGNYNQAMDYARMHRHLCRPQFRILNGNRHALDGVENQVILAVGTWRDACDPESIRELIDYIASRGCILVGDTSW